MAQRIAKINMVTIIFESHGTTLDNELRKASGWHDIELSELGKRQAEELGERYKNEQVDAVFCSDLQRSYRTAEIAFAGKNMPIIKNERLRECNYGDFTGRSSEEVELAKPKHIVESFPNGESYEQATERIRNFLKDLLHNYNGKKIIIVGHRATQYGLERWINHIPLSRSIATPWKWQPGWTYILSVL